MIEITEEQVDKAWNRNIVSPSAVMNSCGEIYIHAKSLGIVKCYECFGDGISTIGLHDPLTGEYDKASAVKCPECNGHGWVHNAK